MVLTATLNKLLKQKKPDKLLLTEIAIKINHHLPDGKKIDLENLPDPLVVLSKVISLNEEQQKEITIYLETMLQADEEEDKKKALNQRAKLILISIGVVVAFVAIVLDPKMITEEFITSLMEMFVQLSSESGN